MVKSDIEIAQAATMEPIIKIAKKLGINEDNLELYGGTKRNYRFRLSMKTK